MSRPPVWPIALLACALLTPFAAAQESGESQTPAGVDTDVSTRLRALEDEVSRLRARVDDEGDGAAPIAEIAGIELDLYGYVKLDASYDDSRTSVGNFARWVESEETNENDDGFDMTAKQTRVGMTFERPLEGTLQTSGRIEIDFYGGDSENKPEPVLRHAYVDLEWPESRWSLLAGQNWDVISPLHMPTINYTVGWWQGNVGYRRPQLRLTKTVDVAADVDLEVALAASRTITNRSTSFTPDDRDTGSDEGFPTMQARVGLTSRSAPGRKAGIGISGHYGEEERDLDDDGDNAENQSWSLNLDAHAQLTERLELQGEVFTGEALDAYLGGIGQGVNATTGDEIEAWGGWLAASVHASARWDLNFGFALDDPEDDDLGSGARRKNRVYFANTWHHLTEHTSLGLEVSYLETDYLERDSGDAFRVQFACLARF